MRVVVDRFGGPSASTVRERLVQNLAENGVQVVPSAEVRRARDRLGIGRMIGAEQAVQLAREVGASVVLVGTVRHERRLWSLQVRVRSAADGAVLGQRIWRGRRLGALASVGREGYERLSEFFDQAPVPAAEPAEPTSANEDEVPWWQRRDGSAQGYDREGAEGEDEPGGDAARDRSTRYDAFRVMVLGGTLYRSLSTDVTVYASQRGAAPTDPASELLEERRAYSSSGIGHAELGGRIEIYPGAFDERQSFPHLGLLLELTHSVGLQTTGLDRSGARLVVPTNQLEVLGAARFRYRFGEARHEPELRVDVGWGTFHYNLALEQLQTLRAESVIPPMQPGYLHVAVGVDLGVVPRYLFIGLEGGGRIGTNIGDDTRNVWGVDTAPSNGLFVTATLKLEIPDTGLFLALNVRYFLFMTTFEGQVGCAPEVDCSGYINPWEDPRLWEVWPVVPPDAGMADLTAVVGGPSGLVLDHYLRSQLVLGYAF